MLKPVHAVGGLRPVQGGLRLRRGQRAGGRYQQEFGLLGGLAVDTVDLTDRGIGFGQRVVGQPGRQQHHAPVDGEVRHQHVEWFVTGGSFGKIRECCWYVIDGVGNQRQIMHHVDGPEHLAGFGEQSFCRGDIRIRACRKSHCVVHQPAMTHRTCRPHLVTRAPQYCDRAARVVQGLGIPAKGQQRDAAQMQHPPRLSAGG